MLYLGAFSLAEFIPMGIVESIFIKTERGRAVLAVERAVAVAGKGLTGDLSFGKRSRQVLLTSTEELSEFGLSPGDIRENLAISGLDFGSLTVGSMLEVGEVVLEVTADCSPCSQLDVIRPGLKEAIQGKRGKLAEVIVGGQIRPNDEAHLVTAAKHNRAV